MGVNYSFLIGDSSDIPYEYKGKLDIIVFHKKYKGVATVVRELSEHIKTDYAVILPDDDVLFPCGIEKCIEFLNKDYEKLYSSCNGLAGIYDTKNRFDHSIRDLGDYNLKGYENNNPLDRVCNLFKDYSVILFGICRTEVFKRVWGTDREPTDTDFFDELMPCFGMVAQGKIKHIDIPYLLRQGHEQTIRHATTFEWIKSPQWHVNQQIFLNHIYNLIDFRDPLLNDDISKLYSLRQPITEEFCCYLAGGLRQRTYRLCIEHKIMNRIKMLFRKMSLSTLRNTNDFIVFKKILSKGYHVNNN
jgi:glycosyltransferase domain-containing protein